jgi:hypothetical protein
MHDIPLVSVITMVQVPCVDIKISMTAVEFTTPMTPVLPGLEDVGAHGEVRSCQPRPLSAILA